jgi:hypothetical protein
LFGLECDSSLAGASFQRAENSLLGRSGFHRLRKNTINEGYGL